MNNKDYNTQLQESLLVLTAIAEENNRNTMKVIKRVERQEKSLYRRLLGRKF